MRSDRMSGLSSEQLDLLVERVEKLLTAPWNCTLGRPKALDLRQALVVACAYLRQNLIQDVLAEIFDVDQPTISRYITQLTPLIEAATTPERPTVKDVKQATKKAIALVDGALWPCWSWKGHKELWAGKYKTTGHGSLVLVTLTGSITYITEPVPGNQHDMKKLKNDPDAAGILKAAGGSLGDKGFIGTDYITTPIRKPRGRKLNDHEKEFNKTVSQHRSAVERAIAHLKTWRILHTDYRRPLDTFPTSFKAATGLYFLKKHYA